MTSRSLETWICSLRGHAPARAQAIDRGHYTLERCWRCDLWVPSALPSTAPLEPPHPRRGKALRDAVILKVIAIERAVHAVGFALLAVGLVVLELKFGTVEKWAASLVGPLSTSGHTTLARYLAKLVNLKPATVQVLVGTALLYAVVEGVEAVGLWRERRWAEYLTVLATAGFLPFEIGALLNKVTVTRVAALVVNLAILVYLVVAKRLFGLPERREEATDWAALEADPLATTHSRNATA